MIPKAKGSTSPTTTEQLPTTQLRHYVEINPPTAEFSLISPGDPVTFMSLDTVWPDGHADVGTEIVWTGQSHSYTPFRRGDVLLPKVSPTFSMGRATVADTPHPVGLASSEVYVLRPRENADARFIAYAVRSTDFLAEGTASQQGVGGLRRVSSGWVGSYNFPQYDLVEQRRIADYLDRETAQIDAMDEALDQLVARLEERRRSIISEFMDPFSECDTVPIGLCAKVTLGKTIQNEPRSNTTDYPVKYIRAANIQPNGVLATDTQSMFANAAEIAALDLRTGDVLVVEGGAGYGRSLTLEEPLAGWVFQNHIIRARPYSGWHGKYIDYGIRHLLHAGYIEQIARGATIPGLSSGNLRSLPLIFRPLNEQRRIADHLDEETAKIDAMIAKAGELRALLDERRSALITATVTGQHPVPEEH